jgi:hypothetical protein
MAGRGAAAQAGRGAGGAAAQAGRSAWRYLGERREHTKNLSSLRKNKGKKRRWKEEQQQ